MHLIFHDTLPEWITHPCLVPYAELPIEQQAKDYVFAAIVRAATAQ